ncbi:MAG: hypothetical protein HRT90_06270 [Candidatus Margulisbacteria bacterium]|nr:hypothetical protein [Candidatus Margulisiibacteriota bacterium]
MSKVIRQALEHAEVLTDFPLTECSPSDDPEMESGFVYGYSEVAKRFIASVKRIGDPELSEKVNKLDANPDYITDAYKLHGDLICIIDDLNYVLENPYYKTQSSNGTSFLRVDIIKDLKKVTSRDYDTKKLVLFCEELNDSFFRENYLSCILLIRAVINHVPPIFGHKTFAQVIANSNRSVKAVLSYLEDQARPIADLHTHMLIRKNENIPTKHQIEPYKPSFEILIQEVIVQLENSKK